MQALLCVCWGGVTTVLKVLKRQGVGGRTEGNEGRLGPPEDAAVCFPLISVGDSA